MKRILLMLLLTFNLIGNPMVIGIGEGNSIPDFELRNTSLEEVDISFLEGKKYVLKFFATWCPNCDLELGGLEEFYDEYGDEVEVVYISVDRSNKALSGYETSLPIYFDYKGIMSRRFLVRNIPMTYVVDEYGVIIDKWSGRIDWSSTSVENLYGGN